MKGHRGFLTPQRHVAGRDGGAEARPAAHLPARLILHGTCWKGWFPQTGPAFEGQEKKKGDAPRVRCIPLKSFYGVGDSD